MKIDGVKITLDHVGREVLVTKRIACYLPQDFVTTIVEVDYDDNEISVVDKDRDTIWLCPDEIKNLSFTNNNKEEDKDPDLFTMDDKSTPLEVEGAYEHRRTVAKKIQTTFNTMVALKKELASAEYLYNEAIKEGDILSLAVEGGAVSGKIKVSYQPEVIVFVGE